MKKIFDAFSNATDAQRTYREVMFLQVSGEVLLMLSYTALSPSPMMPSQAFSSHDHVIQLLNVVKAANEVDLYLVFEFMDTDLHAVIKNKLLLPVHHPYITYQVIY